MTLTATLLEKDSKLLSLESNDISYFLLRDKLASLRSSEIAIYEFSNTITLPSGERMRLETTGKFNMRHITTASALFGIYLTLFILFLLVVSIALPALLVLNSSLSGWDLLLLL